MDKKKQPNFESSLKALEQIVSNMESGNLPLEDAVQQFEQGMQLTKDCQAYLEAAEQRIQILTNQSEPTTDAAE